MTGIAACCARAASGHAAAALPIDSRKSRRSTAIAELRPRPPNGLLQHDTVGIRRVIIAVRAYPLNLHSAPLPSDPILFPAAGLMQRARYYPRSLD
jgi:hypothetical protein